MNPLARARRPVVAAIAVLTLGPGAFAQPRDAGADRPPPRSDQMPSRETVLERLEDGLLQIDLVRDRLTRLKAGLEEGTPLNELMQPEDWGLLMRARRERGQGFAQGLLAGPDSGGPDRPDDRPAFGPPGRGGSERLSEDDLGRVRAIIDEHVPQIAERLSLAEQDNPEAAARFLERLAPRFRDVLELEREAPELVPVRVEELRTGMAIVNAARQLRSIDADDTEATEQKKAEIRTLLARQLELREQLEAHRLEKMAAELEAARSRLRTQSEDRDRIIDEHLTRVLSRTRGPGADRPRGEPGAEGRRGRRGGPDRPRD